MYLYYPSISPAGTEGNILKSSVSLAGLRTEIWARDPSE
jgi:hypothetical protein